MFDNTLGIVLSTIPYNDKTQFLHLYTEHFGKISCSIPVPKSKRATASRAMLAPLSILDMEVKYARDTEVQKIKEVRLLQSPYALMGNPVKTAQCLFMAELLDKCIKGSEADPNLFHFIRQSIELLELTEEGQTNFHLAFVIKLCYLLGFRFNSESYQPGAYFDLSEGFFTKEVIFHPYYLMPESAKRFYDILNTEFSDLPTLAINREQRDQLIDILLTYLKLHIPEMGEIRSVEILKELFI